MTLSERLRDEASNYSERSDLWALLTEAADALTAQAWQPMATAPKDGAKFLLLHPDDSICISYWGMIRGVEGFKSLLHNSEYGSVADFCRDGVGWMPLPPAPTQEDK